MEFRNLVGRLKAALEEDAAFNDLTTNQIPGFQKSRLSAELKAKAPGVFCGGFLISSIFRLLDPQVRVQLKVKDGQFVRPGQSIAKISGRVGALLASERVFLNLVCHLSGIATLTSKFVRAVKGTGAVIVDTRKTTPLWRDLEKFAVKCGGGENHRFSLEDAILVKDNHSQYLRAQKIYPNHIYGPRGLGALRKKLKFIAMEATDDREVWEAIKARADIILLDNMAPNQIKRSLVLIRAARKALNTSKPLVEVSGGMTLDKVREVAKLGVDRISVGALTHSAPVLDLSLEV